VEISRRRSEKFSALNEATRADRFTTRTLLATRVLVEPAKNGYFQRMAFDEMYQEIIRDHYKNPRNKRPLTNLKAMENPSCGDSVKVEVDSDSHQIRQVSFDGSGCSISMCSASMMSELLSGKTVAEAKTLVSQFLSVIRGELPPDTLDDLGDLAALKGIVELPVRVKCATLAWHAVEKALETV